jgi:hypothetical protein
MPPDVGRISAQFLRPVLSDVPRGARIQISDTDELLISLEYFIPAILAEAHPEWDDNECLDGVIPLAAQKVAEDEAVIFGIGIIMSDQTLVPLYLHLQLETSSDTVSWVDCRLGEKAAERLPYASLNVVAERLRRIEPERIDWIYRVVSGEKRGSPAAL